MTRERGIDTHGDSGGKSPRRTGIRLYGVTGSPSTVLALANMRAALAALGLGPDRMEFVDVLDEPDRAIIEGILVTPLLVLGNGPKRRRILGTLQDQARLRLALSEVDTP